MTNEAIVTAKPDAPKCMPPRTGLSGGLVWPCVWLRVTSLTGLFMRQKPARIKSCAVEDVRRLRNFLLARFVSAGDEERLMHEDDSLLRGFVATLLPPSPPPLPFQLESRRNSRRDEKRNTEFLDSRVQRYKITLWL